MACGKLHRNFCFQRQLGSIPLVPWVLLWNQSFQLKAWNMLAIDPWKAQPWQTWVVGARGGEGEIGWTSEHNEINFSNATILATYKKILFEKKQKKAFDYRDKNFKLWLYLFGTTFIDSTPTHLTINFACNWVKKHILEIANNCDVFLFDVSCMPKLGFVASVVFFFLLILIWKKFMEWCIVVIFGIL